MTRSSNYFSSCDSISILLWTLRICQEKYWASVFEIEKVWEPFSKWTWFLRHYYPREYPINLKIWISGGVSLGKLAECDETSNPKASAVCGFVLSCSSIGKPPVDKPFTRSRILSVTHVICWQYKSSVTVLPFSESSKWTPPCANHHTHRRNFYPKWSIFGGATDSTHIVFTRFSPLLTPLIHFTSHTIKNWRYCFLCTR